MAEHFDMKNTHSSAEQLDEWRGKKLTGDLEKDHIPGVGPATIRLLKDNGVNTTFQVFGEYLSCWGPDVDTTGAADDFKVKFLGETGIQSPEKWRNAVVEAILEKLNTGCEFDSGATYVSEEFLVTSMCNHDDIEKFLDMEFSQDLAEDFKGVGPESKKKLLEHGIATTYQLFGLALKSENMMDFKEKLSDAGVASGFIHTIIHQIVEKLKVGLKMPYTCK